MSASTKTRISALLPTDLINVMKAVAEQQETTQSAILQQALQLLFEKKLEEDAKFLATLDFSDIGSEKDWFLAQAEALKNDP